MGVYEVAVALGAGGMGEVYRALDTRLGRDVALKVLPAEFAQDPARRLRFEREARSVAALNHPNIVALYDIGTQDGVAYMVTELVEGESLRGVHLQPRKIADIAAQIADGLAAAHAAGVTHRDLKPDNIMMTRDGRIKILDFGVAKLTGPIAENAVTGADTDAGIVVGTIGYMSPEQVRGAAIDHRADIFAFGVLLYEMITGSRAFTADTAAEVMTAILKNDPPELPSEIPAGLRQIVNRCLEKTPEQRFQSAQDLAFALRHFTGSSPNVTGVSEPQTARTRSYRRITAVGLIIGIALGIAFAGAAAVRLAAARDSEIDSARLTRFSSDRLDEREPAFSPDGRSIAYLRSGTDFTELLVKALDAPSPITLVHGNARFAETVWLPDGKQICYVVRPARDLMCVGALGGTPQRLLENVWSPRFTADGKSLYFIRVADGAPWLFLSSPPGSEARKVGSSALPLDLSHISPVSPDSRHIIALTRTERLLVSLPDWARQTLPMSDEGVRTVSVGWFPDSRHIVAEEELTELIGSRLVAEDTQTGARRLILHTADPLAELSISADGKRLAYTGGPVERDLLEYSGDGKFVRTVADSSQLEGFASWAPAGDRFVYRVGGPGQIDSLWMGRENSDAVEFVQRFPSNRASQSRISPDGGRIAFADSPGILIVSVSGGRPIQAYSSSRVDSVCWSPDGEWIWFSEGPPHLARLHSQGGEPQTIKASPGVLADCSPDGRWLLRQVQTGIVLTSTDGTQDRLIARLEDYPSVPKGTLQFGEGGKVVYVLGRNRRSIDVLDATSGKKLRTITFAIPSENSIQTFSVNSTGSRILLDSGGDRNDVWIAEDFTQPSTSWMRWLRHWN